MSSSPNTSDWLYEKNLLSCIVTQSLAAGWCIDDDDGDEKTKGHSSDRDPAVEMRLFRVVEIIQRHQILHKIQSGGMLSKFHRRIIKLNQTCPSSKAAFTLLTHMIQAKRNHVLDEDTNSIPKSWLDLWHSSIFKQMENASVMHQLWCYGMWMDSLPLVRTDPALIHGLIRTLGTLSSDLEAGTAQALERTLNLILQLSQHESLVSHTRVLENGCYQILFPRNASQSSLKLKAMACQLVCHVYQQKQPSSSQRLSSIMHQSCQAIHVLFHTYCASALPHRSSGQHEELFSQNDSSSQIKTILSYCQESMVQVSKQDFHFDALGRVLESLMESLWMLLSHTIPVLALDEKQGPNRLEMLLQLFTTSISCRATEIGKASGLSINGRALPSCYVYSLLPPLFHHMFDCWSQTLCHYQSQTWRFMDQWMNLLHQSCWIPSSYPSCQSSFDRLLQQCLVTFPEYNGSQIITSLFPNLVAQSSSSISLGRQQPSGIIIRRAQLYMDILLYCGTYLEASMRQHLMAFITTASQELDFTAGPWRPLGNGPLGPLDLEDVQLKQDVQLTLPLISRCLQGLLPMKHQHRSFAYETQWLQALSYHQDLGCRQPSSRSWSCHHRWLQLNQHLAQLIVQPRMSDWNVLTPHHTLTDREAMQPNSSSDCLAFSSIDTRGSEVSWSDPECRRKTEPSQDSVTTTFHHPDRIMDASSSVAVVPTVEDPATMIEAPHEMSSKKLETSTRSRSRKKTVETKVEASFSSVLLPSSAKRMKRYSRSNDEVHEPFLGETPVPSPLISSDAIKDDRAEPVPHDDLNCSVAALEEQDDDDKDVGYHNEAVKEEEEEEEFPEIV